jgi:type I restriction enzyme S subunit
MSNLGDVLRQVVCTPNNIPEDWSFQKLTNVCSPKQWRTVSSSEMSETGYPVFGANGFVGFYPEYNHADETIAITCRGNTCGTINRIPPKTYITGNSMALDNVQSNVISQNYLYYALKYRGVGDSISGSAQPQITGAGLRAIEFPAPPLREQQKIAAILSSVDDVIEKARAQIDKLKDLKTGMMQDLLSKGIGSNGTPHTEFKDSPVGRVPASWEIASISEIQAKEKYSCVGGPFGSDLTSKHYVEKAGVPVIRGSNLPLDFRRFIDDGFVYVSEEKADTLAKNMAYPGDLVFTQRGTLGQVGLIPEKAKFSRYVISQSQMKLRVDESAADKEYLYQFFLSGHFLRALDQQTIATGLPHINLGILKSFLIPLPPVPEQIEIGKALYSVDQKTSALRTKLETHIALKKALMQDLLTGKVRVKVDQKESAVA